MVESKQGLGPRGSGPVQGFVPAEYMGFRDTSQVTAAQDMGLDSGAAGLRPRPNKEPSKHLGLRCAQHRTSTGSGGCGVLPIFGTMTATLTANAGRLPFSWARVDVGHLCHS